MDDTAAKRAERPAPNRHARARDQLQSLLFYTSKSSLDESGKKHCHELIRELAAYVEHTEEIEVASPTSAVTSVEDVAAGS